MTLARSVGAEPKISDLPEERRHMLITGRQAVGRFSIGGRELSGWTI